MQKDEEGKAADEKKPLDDVEDIPDPDEDDLDDLDDMLDEFSSVKIEPRITAPSSGTPQSAPQPPAPPGVGSPTPEEALSDDDFAKQLQSGMAELLGEIENSPEAQAQMENLVKELGAAMGTAEPTGTASGSSASTQPQPAPSGSDASFQETIRRTMERMQASGEQATAAAAAGGSDDFMAELLKQMQGGGFDGAGSEEEFSKMLLGMMEQLTNKEILYEPMNELNQKFPDWLAKNRDATPADDLKRYEEQQGYVREIVAKFEEPNYADSNAADREFIVDRMQKMQAAGAPPADLVGDMPSAQDALNADESCTPQ